MLVTTVSVIQGVQELFPGYKYWKIVMVCVKNDQNKQTTKKNLGIWNLKPVFSPETWIYNTCIWTSLVVSKTTLQGEKEWCSVSRAICLCLSCILSMLFSLLVRGRGGYVGGGGVRWELLFFQGNTDQRRIFIYNRVLTGASVSFNFYSWQTFCAKNMRGSRHWMEPFLWLRKWWLAALASKDMWRVSLTTRQRGRSWVLRLKLWLPAFNEVT